MNVKAGIKSKFPLVVVQSILSLTSINANENHQHYPHGDSSACTGFDYNALCPY